MVTLVRVYARSHICAPRLRHTSSMLRRAASFSACSVVGFGSAYLLYEDNSPGHNYAGNPLDHPFVKAQQQSGWTVASTSKLPKYHLRQMVTTSLLSGEGKIESEPLTLTKDGVDQTLYFVGRDLATPKQRSWWEFGARDPVHNGIGVTILDQGLARTAFAYLPNKLGVTAYLDVDFVHDIPENTFIVLKAQVTGHSKRKSKAQGSIYEVNGSKLGKELMRGEVLMVEPSWAKHIAWLLRNVMVE